MAKKTAKPAEKAAPETSPVINFGTVSSELHGKVRKALVDQLKKSPTTTNLYVQDQGVNLSLGADGWTATYR